LSAGIYIVYTEGQTRAAREEQNKESALKMIDLVEQYKLLITEADEAKKKAILKLI